MDVGEIHPALDLNGDDISIRVGGHFFPNDDVGIGRKLNQDAATRGIPELDADRLSRDGCVSNDAANRIEDLHDAG